MSSEEPQAGQQEHSGVPPRNAPGVVRTLDTNDGRAGRDQPERLMRSPMEASSPPEELTTFVRQVFIGVLFVLLVGSLYALAIIDVVAHWEAVPLTGLTRQIIASSGLPALCAFLMPVLIMALVLAEAKKREAPERAGIAYGAALAAAIPSYFLGLVIALPAAAGAQSVARDLVLSMMASALVVVSLKTTGSLPRGIVIGVAVGVCAFFVSIVYV